MKKLGQLKLEKVAYLDTIFCSHTVHLLEMTLALFSMQKMLPEIQETHDAHNNSQDLISEGSGSRTM